MGQIRRFQDLEVWQKAHWWVIEIYKLTQGFPPEERYGLISQARRAAVSVPANIAEGFKRKGVSEKIRFYNIAEASLEEVRYYLILAQDLEYVATSSQLQEKAEEISRMLYGLIQALNRSGK